MKVDLRYLGRSGLRTSETAQSLAFSPNLARTKVFFDAELVQPLRFREAMSALHEVVVGDLRFKPKDKSAYRAWKAQQAVQEAQLRQAAFSQAKESLSAKANEPLPPNLEKEFRAAHLLYWTARRRWADELARNDPDLFRHLVPCDPVVTVAPDIVFFECFAKDESAYGYLGVDRGAFRGEAASGLGTTNVDYSLGLYEHFQTLRSYRSTRLLVDPEGFGVSVRGGSDYREEKIDLPSSWLRGFGQLQAALALPSRRVELSVDVVYSILAFLLRHREKKGPRSLLFKLQPGRPPIVVLEPWGVELVSRGPLYQGEKPEQIKVWGRRRLMPLARTLPLAERFEVLLLGSGLPSVWTAHLGEMRFVLALSGWTTNDWTSGSNLEQHFAGFRSDDRIVDKLTAVLEQERLARVTKLAQSVEAPREVLLGSLHELARRGQVVYDFTTEVYRYRPILPVALTDAMLGPESPEVVAGRKLVSETSIERQESLDRGAQLIVARVQNSQCEGVMDVDGAFSRARCNCSFFYKYRLRAGPCRHLMALRTVAIRSSQNTQTAVRERVELLVHLPLRTAQELRAEAERRTVSTSLVAEQAWRIAREPVAAMQSIEQVQAATPYRTAAKEQVVLMLPQDVYAEVQREAARLDATVSSVWEAAWKLSYETLRKMPSLFN